MTSVIVVPLVARGKTLGAITLVSAESGRRYDETDLELAGELARHAALAVDNTWLYEEARREILERRRAEEALRSSRNELEIILQGVADGITAQDPTGRLVYANEAAAKIIGYPSVRALMEAPVPEVMRRYEVMDESGRPFPPEDLPGRRALRGEPSPAALLRFREIETGKERWSMVKATPIFDEQGRVLLAVNILRDVTEGRRTEEALREVRRVERARIARDLHDSSLQDLSYAVAETQIVQQLAEDPKLEDRLQQAIEALQRAGRGLRSAVYDLRQEDVEGRSFLRSVDSLVGLHRQMNPGRELELTVAHDFPEKLPEAAARELLSIVQEALTNARRHSDARNALITLRVEKDELVVEVTDDGRGFDPEGLAGVGLRSMRERTTVLGGTLAVESEPGEGTRVRARVPVRTLLGGASEAGSLAERDVDRTPRSER
jgi:PAS domain S-box-containing protein